MRLRTVAVIAAAMTTLLVGIGSPAARGTATDIRGTLANGWVRHELAGHGSATPIADVVAAGPGFVAVTEDPSHSLSVWTSSDGLSWRRYPGDATAYLLSLRLDDPTMPQIIGMSGGDQYTARPIGPQGQWIAVGRIQPAGKPVADQRAAVWLSKDGWNWRLVSNKSPTFRHANMVDVERFGPGWVAVGQADNEPGYDGPLVWTSKDALHWTRLPQQPAFLAGGAMGRLVKGPRGLLSIGAVSGLGAVAWSSMDGLHWQRSLADGIAQGSVNEVIVGGLGYLVIGERDADPTLWSSVDGLTWTQAAGAASFTGDNTQLSDVAVHGQTVVVGDYGTGSGRSRPSIWTWTPALSQHSPTPVPRTTTIDPKIWRIHLDDLPAGYTWHEGGWADLCDDGATLCNDVFKAIGRYRAYQFDYYTSGPPAPLTEIEGMAIEGTYVRPHALRGLGIKLLKWWNRGVKVRRLSPGVRIGQETQLFTFSTIIGGSVPGTAYLVNWRDGKAIGDLLVARDDRSNALVTKEMALRLARLMRRHLRAVQRR